MSKLVTYRLEDSIATITMDDGKVNVMSQRMASELNGAFDRADRVVPAGDLQDEARKVAATLAKLNMAAHAATKLRARAQTLKAIRAAIEADDTAFRPSG